MSHQTSFRFLGLGIALFFFILKISVASVVIVSPGNEKQISIELNNGNNVQLIAGEWYSLNSLEAVIIYTSNVELDGNNATLYLESSFNNFEYDPAKLHKNNVGNFVPKESSFGIYIGNNSNVDGENTANITIKNLNIVRDAVSGSVVRSIAIVNVDKVRLENIRFTGNTIGPIIDIINSDDFIITGCLIHNSHADNSSGNLLINDIKATDIGLDKLSPKPNLTGILVDDVDIIENRKSITMQSQNFKIVNNRIENLTMSNNVNENSQTDGINIQRGHNYHVYNNVIINTDEGIDTFGYKGIIRDNVIKLSNYSSSGVGAGIKLVHGASHNYIHNNTIINRSLSTIMDSSDSVSLSGEKGVYGNMLLRTHSLGLADTLYRISINDINDFKPSINFLISNTNNNQLMRNGYGYSSDWGDSEPNVYLGNVTCCDSSAHQLDESPGETILGDFFQNSEQNDIAFYNKNTGQTDLFLRTASAGFDDYNFNVVKDALCKGDVNCHYNHKNMTHMFKGTFFRSNLDLANSDLLFIDLNATSNEIINRLQRNDGSGTFSQFSYELDDDAIPSIYEHVVVGDFNGDGLNDVFFHSVDDGLTRGYRNDDDSATSGVEFSRISNEIVPSKIKNEIGNNIVVVKTGDFNGDGKTDLFFLWEDGLNKIFLGDNGFTFSSEHTLTTQHSYTQGITNPERVQITDYNFDGYDDVLLKSNDQLRRLYQCDNCNLNNVRFSQTTELF